MHNDFYKRYVTDLPDHVWEDLAVSTILDPRFKNFDFPGATVEQRALAMGYLRSAWVADWKPASPNLTTWDVVASMPKPTNSKKQTFGDFLASVSVPQPNNARPSGSVLDELAKYLALPQEDNTELDVLQWWKSRVREFPHLSKMARQFLAAPATSAGPERLFRLAGRMHDDMKKATKEGTLQHSLMAALNNDY